MTFSIAAWDEASGRLGAAISSSSISVASRCLHWRAGVGVALSQNVTDPRLGPRLLDLLAGGHDPAGAVAAVRAATAHIEYRQLALVDRTGRTASFTGERVLGRFAEAAGRHCVAAGNLLGESGVPAAMVDAFESRDGDFGSRLLAALEAGIGAGGEAGPVHSAGLLIGGDPSWPLAELRIDWADDPMTLLAAGWAIYQPQIDDYLLRAYDPEAAPAYGVPGDPAA